MRSDVYSLGVILYEILTGVRPYEMEGRATLEVLRVICEETPRRPGEAAGRSLSESRRHPRLDRELARRPTASSQLRKLVSRHKGGFAVSAALIALLAVFAALMTAQVEQTGRERDRAARSTRVWRRCWARPAPVEGRGRDATGSRGPSGPVQDLEGQDRGRSG